MRIKFLKDCEIELVTRFDEATDQADTENEIFVAGSVHEVDVLDEREGSLDVQFGDGSVAYGVPNSLFAKVWYAMFDYGTNLLYALVNEKGDLDRIREGARGGNFITVDVTNLDELADAWSKVTMPSDYPEEEIEALKGRGA